MAKGKKNKKTFSTEGMMKQNKSITKVDGSVTLFTIPKEELNRIHNTGFNTHVIGTGSHGGTDKAQNRKSRKQNKQKGADAAKLYNSCRSFD